MKKLIKRIAAAVGAGVILTAAAVPSAFAAEEKDTSAKLPSGMTVNEAVFELDNIYSGSDEVAQVEEDENMFASAAIGIFKGDEVLSTKYYGRIDIENNIRADENSVYEWGSISKTLIWVSAMQLYEQGKLDLEKDVRDYLPDNFFQHLSYDEPITMLNLMNHSAGWCETTRPIETKSEDEVLPLKEALQAIEPAQIYRPGEKYTYSNYGAAVAGYVIECASGMDYCEYVHKNIFEPLGMEHTALNPTHSDCKYVYENRPKTQSYQFIFGKNTSLGNRLHFISAYPAGAAAGTLSDLMTYAQALVNDSAPLFRNKSTQELMFEGTSFYGNSDIPMNCHGFWSEEHAVRVVGHSGATNAGQADMVFDRESKIGLVVMINEPNGNIYISKAPDIVFGSLSPDIYGENAADSHKLSGYWVGTRDRFRGMFSYMPYLSAVSGSSLGEFETVGSGVSQIREGQSAILVGEVNGSDGSTEVIQTPSNDYIPVRFYIAKISLLAAYILTAVGAFYLVRIRLKMRKTGRWKKYAGSGAIFAGQTANIVSVLLFITAFTIGNSSYGGIKLSTATLIGIAQMLCIAVSAAAIIIAAAGMLSKKEKARPYRYILSFTGNAVCIGAIVFFELYRFWGC